MVATAAVVDAGFGLRCCDCRGAVTAGTRPVRG